MKTGLLASLFFVVLALTTTRSEDRSRAILTEPFDTPIEKMIVDLGPSLSNPPGMQNIRNKLSCYWFSMVMVKEYDTGQKGADWLSFLRMDPKTHPECSRSHSAGEVLLDEGGSWIGYFKGVKGDFVFFDGDDSQNGGLPFAVYDSRTGKKLFEDSAYKSNSEDKTFRHSAVDRMQISRAEGGPLVLKYQRVVEAGCDVRTASCWAQVRMKLKVKTLKTPVCVGYDAMAAGIPSIVAYPVSVSLDSPPVITTIAGPVQCWPPA